jgi:flagellin-like hook-associated protein FlgL
LGEILGEDHISSSSKIDEPVTFTSASAGNEWVTTGKNKYDDYLNNRNVNISTNHTKVAGKLGVADLEYDTITGLANTSVSGNVVTWSDANGNTAKFTYASGLDSSEKVLQNAQYYSTGSGTRLETHVVSNYYGCDDYEGSKAYAGRTYYTSWMDFSELGTKYQVSDLYNQGFNSVCATCTTRHYSILFTDGSDGNYQSTAAGTNYSYESGSSQLLKIDISSCTTGSDIVQAIMDASQNSPLTNHYTQYAYKNGEDAKLYVFDNRDMGQLPEYKKGTFEPISRSTTGVQISSKTVTYTGTDGLTYTYDDRDMWIQTGALGHSGLLIEKPWLTVERLGIDRIGVSDYDMASNGIEICDSALAMISDERSEMGAYTNRLEHTVNSNKNNSENTQSAESRLRDADMADEMVEYSKANILAQAGQSVLAQANQMQQGLLQLLQ